MTGDETPEPTYRFHPHLDLIAYAGKFYAQDTSVQSSPVVDFETQEVSEALFKTLHLIKANGVLLEPATRSEVHTFLNAHQRPHEHLDTAIAVGFLVPRVSAQQRVQDKVLARLTAQFGNQPQSQSDFSTHETNRRFFPRNTFFNLPYDVIPTESHVGIMGLPYASVPTSAGTQAAPDVLRLASRSLSWLDLCKHGVYSEVLMPNGKPDIQGAGVVLRDCGNLACNTPADLLQKLQETLARDFIPHDVRPLFIGGDHALTYPIVTAMLDHFPDMGLLHIDAHNDLFYVSEVSFNHAAVLSNIIQGTPIEKVACFGLRTVMDKRVSTLKGAYGAHNIADRVDLHPITSLKQMIMSPGALAECLTGLQGRPFYLSLDLDVLSSAAIGDRLSTPLGAGLEWHELYVFLAECFARLDVIGCDVVEYNVLNGQSVGERQINALLVQIIDGLARGSAKPLTSQPKFEGV